MACVTVLVGTDLYPRAVAPDLKSSSLWICPQCSMHLCRNNDKTSNLCLICWKPSQRSGQDMGGDMICCDNGVGSLFHKKCVNYLLCNPSSLSLVCLGHHSNLLICRKHRHIESSILRPDKNNKITLKTESNRRSQKIFSC